MTVLDGDKENPLLDSRFPDVSGKGRGYQIQTLKAGLPEWPELRKVSIWQTVGALEEVLLCFSFLPPEMLSTPPLYPAMLTFPSSCNALLCPPLRYSPLCCTALHYASLHCTALRFTALHFTALRFTALHCTALHYASLHCTALRFIPSVIIYTHDIVRTSLPL